MQRGLTAKDAANYCGVSLSCFHSWIKKGIIPKPWNGTKRFDKHALDLSLDKLSGIEHHSSPYDDWKKGQEECA